MTKSRTKYTGINIKAERFYHFEANPSQLICSPDDKEPIRQLFDLMALSAKKQGLDKNQKLLNWITLDQLKVTVDEALTSFWKAMADPYVPSGSGIEVRHLMKYITETREKKNIKLYTYEQVLRLMDKENIPQNHFEITETIQNGKKMWRRI